MFSLTQLFKKSHGIWIALIMVTAIITACGKPVSQMAQLGSKLPEPPEGFTWQLMPEASDEFNGSALDTVKWMDHHPWSRGRPPSYFEPKNIFIRNGNLELLSTTTKGDSEKVKDPLNDEWVRAACVSSKEPVLYGYYETRMQAANLDMTSSFWFHGKYSEIDVVEQFGSPVKNPDMRMFMQSNTHYKSGTPDYAKTPARWRMPSGAADEYHIFAVWWKDKNTICFYHNNEKVNEVTTNEFLEPQHLIFDMEVMKDWSGLPTVETLLDPARNTFYVDWVRGWKVVEKK